MIVIGEERDSQFMDDANPNKRWSKPKKHVNQRVFWTLINKQWCSKKKWKTTCQPTEFLNADQLTYV